MKKQCYGLSHQEMKDCTCFWEQSVERVIKKCYQYDKCNRQTADIDSQSTPHTGARAFTKEKT